MYNRQSCTITPLQTIFAGEYVHVQYNISTHYTVQHKYVLYTDLHVLIKDLDVLEVAT